MHTQPNLIGLLEEVAKAMQETGTQQNARENQPRFVVRHVSPPRPIRTGPAKHTLQKSEMPIKVRRNIAVVTFINKHLPKEAVDLSRLLDKGEMLEFYSKALRILEQLRKSAERSKTANALDIHLRHVSGQRDGLLNYIQTRSVEEDKKPAEPIVLPEGFIRYKLLCGKSVEELLQTKAAKDAADELNLLLTWAGLSLEKAIGDIIESLVQAKSMHNEIITAAKLVKNPDTGPEGQIALAESEIRAINSNITMLGELLKMKPKWDNVLETLDLLRKKIEGDIAQDNLWEDYDAIRAWQSFNTITGQIKDQLRRRKNALAQLEQLRFDSANDKRRKLAATAPENNHYPSRWTELTSQLMGKTLAEADLTNLGAILNVSNHVGIEALAVKLLGTKNWFPLLMERVYFVASENQGPLLDTIVTELLRITGVDLRTVTKTVEAIAANPSEADMYEYLLKEKTRLQILQVADWYIETVRNGLNPKDAETVVLCVLDLSIWWNDEPINTGQMLFNLAWGLNTGEPVRVYYEACLRYDYTGKIMHILTEVRDRELEVFENLLKIFEHYKVPVEPVVMVSQLELIKSHELPANDERFEHATEFTHSLAGRYPELRVQLITEALEQLELLNFFEQMYVYYQGKIREARTLEHKKAWCGLYHVSIQHIAEKEYRKHAAVETGFDRDFMWIFTTNHMAKGMAIGACFGRVAKYHPLIVVAAGRQPAVEMEMKGVAESNGGEYGIMFIPTAGTIIRGEF